MRVINAIFTKQLNDFPRNFSISIMFVLYPGLAWLMTTFMGEGGDAISLGFVMMFVGSVPLISIANTIAEDNEYKSLRFLVMAGVKPVHYLSGLGGFAMAMSVLPILAFALIMELSGQYLLIFLAICLLGCFASVVVGAVAGIFSKNVQQASVYYTILMFVIGFSPFFIQFNPNLAAPMQFLFTTQIFFIVLEMVIGYEAQLFFNQLGITVNTAWSFIIIGANIAVFLILFAIIYKKKGLKG